MLTHAVAFSYIFIIDTFYLNFLLSLQGTLVQHVMV